MKEALEDWDALDNKTKIIILRYAKAHKKLVESAPGVDAVEVVKCKDCKSWTRHGGVASYSPTGACSSWADTTLGVDFCSYGERRTDATD
jgi:hypothetical protein